MVTGLTQIMFKHGRRLRSTPARQKALEKEREINKQTKPGFVNLDDIQHNKLSENWYCVINGESITYSGCFRSLGVLDRKNIPQVILLIALILRYHKVENDEKVKLIALYYDTISKIHKPDQCFSNVSLEGAMNASFIIALDLQITHYGVAIIHPKTATLYYISGDKKKKWNIKTAENNAMAILKFLKNQTIIKWIDKKKEPIIIWPNLKIDFHIDDNCGYVAAVFIAKIIEYLSNKNNQIINLQAILQNAIDSTGDKFVSPKVMQQYYNKLVDSYKPEKDSITINKNNTIISDNKSINKSNHKIPFIRKGVSFFFSLSFSFCLHYIF